MNSTKNTWVWVALIAVGIIAIAALFLATKTPGSTRALGSSVNGGNVTDYDAVNVTGGYYLDDETIVDANGNISLTGGTISTTGTTISIDGITTTYARDNSLTAATTTVCALQSPAATSTLQPGSGALFTVSSSTASLITLAKAATAFATTTLLGQATIAAGAQGTVIASTSPLTTLIDPAMVFGPSQWFVVGMSGGIGTFSPTGVCTASWVDAD